jgi:hypothetical protein
VTSLVSPQAANIERAGSAVLGMVINALDAAGAAAGTSGAMEDRTHQIKAEESTTKEARRKALAAQAARIRAKAKRLLGNRST